MAYEKQNFLPGQKLKAAQLNHMEEYIAAADKTSADLNALANTVATMTIEGYEATEGVGYVDVKPEAEKRENVYCYKGWDSGASKSIPIVAAIDGWNVYVLPVSEGEQYKIETCCGYAAFAYCVLDANGHILAFAPNPVPQENIVYKGEISIPANAVTMYMNEKPGEHSLVIKRKGGIGGILEFKRTEQSLSSDHLYGKKIACVGDSITEASNPAGGYFTNYAELAAARHSMSVYKDGKGGTTMTNVDGHNPFCVNRYLSVPSDFDILTIWFGWNDGAYATVGTIDDTEDTTYYGAYKKVLNYFITTYPTKKIGLIVPYGNVADYQ